MARRMIGTGPSERPHERLLKRGPATLSDAEVLAILLFGGCSRYEVLELAERLLSDGGGLLGVSRMDPAELRARPGIGAARAAALAAAVELGRRMGKPEAKKRHLAGPKAASRYLERLLEHERRKLYGLLSLDNRYRLLHQHWPETVATEPEYSWSQEEGVDECGLIKQALLDNASCIIVFRNQSSAPVKMKPADLKLLWRLTGACKILGMPLLDYLVIGNGRWVSARLEVPSAFRFCVHSGWGSEENTCPEIV